MAHRIVQTLLTLAVLFSFAKSLELPASLPVQHQSLSTAARSFSAMSSMAFDVSAFQNSAITPRHDSNSVVNQRLQRDIVSAGHAAPLPVCFHSISFRFSLEISVFTLFCSHVCAGASRVRCLPHRDLAYMVSVQQPVHNCPKHERRQVFAQRLLGACV